MNNEIRDTEVL